MTRLFAAGALLRPAGTKQDSLPFISSYCKLLALGLVVLLDDNDVILEMLGRLDSIYNSKELIVGTQVLHGGAVHAAGCCYLRVMLFLESRQRLGSTEGNPHLGGES
jgi:hypothetical protein